MRESGGESGGERMAARSAASPAWWPTAARRWAWCAGCWPTAGCAPRWCVLGIAFFLVNASAQWMVFEALGADVPFIVVLAVVALGAMAGVAVGTPGGLGGAEAAMIASFTAFGVAPLDAAAGSLLFRALHFVVILGLGTPSLVWLEMRLGRPPGPARPASPATNDPPNS